MRRPRFGFVLLFAAVLATAGVIPLFALPAGATGTCNNGTAVPGGEFPNTPGAQSAWKIDCTTTAGTKVDNITIADAGDSYWHRGAARTASVTIANNAASITIPGLQAADLRRPISGGCLKGGTFIKAVSGTTATLSQIAAATGCGATTVTIEHTYSRVIVDASCTASPASVITSASAKFVAADVGMSVSGGPFKIGSRITAVGVSGANTTATVKLASGVAAGNAACTAPDTLTIGATKYTTATASTVAWSTDPMAAVLQNSAAGQAFSCAVVSGHAKLTQTTAGQNAGQSFTTAYAGLKVVLKGTATTATSVLASPAPTATALTLAATVCPAGITATVGTAAIGQPGANAPKAGNSMASLSAELNLNPTLVSTQDNCNLNTYEGFQVIGTWSNPLNAAGTAFGYGSGVILGSPTLVSTGQILFPTSVVSFAAYIRPQRTGGIAGGAPAGSHFEFVFPSLPTTLAVCLTGGNPSNATALAFGLNPTVLSTTPALPTGGGNPSDPAIRALGPQTGATHGEYLLKNGTTTVATGALPTCTIPVNTATPGFACGDG